MGIKSLVVFCFFLCSGYINMYAQQKVTISGSVVNESGQPLIGATVVESSTSNTILTDQQGHFSLLISSANATLEVSYTGYITAFVPLDNQSTINVVLKETTSKLDEVVVIGYGTQKKASLTSAVSTLDGDKITKIPITNISNGLGGRASGVIALQGSGEPGLDGSNLTIRGISTIGNSSPLLLVDGIPRNFQNLDPNSIESFTVLKDAAATAPYGVAGANGVILVTTKMGHAGKTKVNYNGYFGYQSPTVLWDQANGYQVALLQNLGNENVGLGKVYTDEELQYFKDGSKPDLYPPLFDIWGAIMQKPSILTDHSIDVSGGSNKFSYYFNFGYQDQDGMWRTANSKRYNFSLGLTGSISPTTKLQLKINGIQKSSHHPPSDQNASISQSTVRLFELIKYAVPQRGPLYYSNGMVGAYAITTINGSGYRKLNQADMFTQVSLTQDLPFINGLKIKGEFAFDPTLINDKLWTTPVHHATVDRSQDPYVINDGILGPKTPSLTQTQQINSNYTYRALLDYNRSFGLHDISFTGVFESINRKVSSLGASRKNFGLFMDEMSMGSSDKADQSNSGSSSESSQVGLVYRMLYNYNNKYLFEATGRYDGHYYFAPSSRWGFFPAFSAGWRISNEKFIKESEGLHWINNLKLRLSYGEVGALAGGPYQYLSLYSLRSPGYAFGGAGVLGAFERSEANPNITWEKAKKTNLGIDIGLWGNLFNISVDYFFEKRSNMLISPDTKVPSEYGIGLGQVNAGIMQNQGFEVEMGINKVLSKKLQIGINGTVTYSRNKLIRVFESSATFDNPNRRITGRPLGTQFGFKEIGYFDVSDFDQDGNLKSGIAFQPWGKVAPGDLRYQDTNGDNVLDINDYVPIGNPANPGFIYGFTPVVKYGNFSLTVLFQGIANTSRYFSQSAIWPFFNGRGAYVQNFDYWRPDNKNAEFPRITPTPTVNNQQTSSKWMYNTSYLRIKSATLAYDLPVSLTKKIGIENFQVYVSAQNWVTWAGFIGEFYDPESINGGGYNYPQQKVIAIGLHTDF